jgi:hypothetical protein
MFPLPNVTLAAQLGEWLVAGATIVIVYLHGRLF